MNRSKLCLGLAAALMFFMLHPTQAQNINGAYYSVWQWYETDSLLHFRAPQGRIRSMQYVDLKLNGEVWEAGLSAEYYLPQALLGFNPGLKQHFLGWYARYRKDRWDFTAGNLYDQFGSGMVYRSWNDKQLGLDNALRGVRIRYDVSDNSSVRVVAGNLRTGMSFAPVFVGAAHWSQRLDLPSGWQLTAGFSGLTRYYTPENNRLPANVNLYGASVGLTHGDWDFSFEYDYKTPDALFVNGVLNDRVLFDGDAYTFNAGYARKGLGLNLSLRRTENIRMYAMRSLQNNPYNTGVINYVPALIKQHDYPLATIYVYSIRQGISFADATVGEIGGQADMVFRLKRGSPLGGHYGTVVSLNYSRWHALDAVFYPARGIYRRPFLGAGPLYYQDANMEIKRKLSRNWKTAFFAMFQSYNQALLEGHGDMVRALTLVTDWTRRLGGGSSVRFEAEHMWTAQDQKNWAEAGLEYTWKGNIGLFVNDMYNYGSTRIHYYNAGLVYMNGGNRIQLGYGRQKGGLVCVGGVCRYVPPNKGVQLSVSLSLF